MAYMIILGFIVANIIMLPLCMFYCNFLATAVLRLKREILSGIVLVLCVTGAFAAVSYTHLPASGGEPLHFHKDSPGLRNRRGVHFG